MQRSTTDDLREIMAYYQIQAQDRAVELWEQKMAQLEQQKSNSSRGLGSMNVPQRAPGT